MDFCDNLRYQLEAVPGLAIISFQIAAEQILNPGWALIEFTQDDKNEILKKLTGCVVGTDANVAIYPLGYTTVVIFDEDGNPIP